MGGDDASKTSRAERLGGGASLEEREGLSQRAPLPPRPLTCFSAQAPVCPLGPAQPRPLLGVSFSADEVALPGSPGLGREPLGGRAAVTEEGD